MPQFSKRKPGNPVGRPKGIPDKRTDFRKMFESRAPEIIERCIEFALAGNDTCMRLVVERLAARVREDVDKTEGQTVLEMLNSGKLKLAD